MNPTSRRLLPALTPGVGAETEGSTENSQHSIQEVTN